MAARRDALPLRLFPMPSPEKPGRLQAGPIDVVETARVDGNPVRLRARNVERMHAAMRTEGVLGHPGLEGVHLSAVLPRSNSKSSGAIGR